MRILLSSLISLGLLAGLQYPTSAEETGASASRGVSLTVYNQNFALVKDLRTMELHTGINHVRFSDVASQIDPTSVSLQSVTAPNSIVVREQNYQYDLIDPNTVLSKSVGKTLKFKQVLQNGSVREFTGTLLNAPEATVSSPDGGIQTRSQGLVIKTSDGILLNPSGQIEVAELPPGLISKPSLLWKLETNKPGSHDAEVAYQTQGINWKSDYVAILNSADSQLDLNSWVTIDNRSGATYNNASLKLLAGDVHRVVQQDESVNMACDAAAPMAAPMPQQFSESAFAEYHLYKLNGKTDVGNNETKQLSLFNADKIPVKKLFIYDPQTAQVYPMSGGDGTKQKVQVKIEVENSQKNNMGMPMPKGKVRVFKRDDDGALQFIGEDEVDHTSKDEKIRLYIGDAFDLVGEHKLMNQENVSSNIQRHSFEVSLRNHKDEPVTVTVVEHPAGDWSVLNSSSPYTRKDANTLEFAVQVPPNKEAKITYQIEYRYR